MGGSDEDPTAIECSVDLDDGIELDVKGHEENLALASVMEVNKPKDVDVEQPHVKKEPEAAPAPAKDLEDNKRGWCTRKIFIICAICLLIIVAIVLAVVLTGDNDESLSPTSPTTSNLLEILKPFTPVETMLNPDTPQGQALMELEAEVEASGETPTDQQVKQRYALMVLYLATNPGGWDNKTGWKDFDADECSWYGITCDSSSAVTDIALSDNGLKGELPDEICALSENLATIDVSGNNLEGQIPRCLRDFDKLEGIQMSNNTFGGWIPTYLLSIPTMKTVDLSGNQIGGKAANLFLFGGAATGLTNVLLQNNLLDGDFPVEVEGYPNLSELRLEGNVVTGEVSNSTCSLQGTTFLATLSADCQEVTCDCCTECF